MPDKPEQETDNIVSLSMYMIPNDDFDQPVMANYSVVSVVQQTAYIDFRFIDPTKSGPVQKKELLPKTLQGRLVSSIAMPLDAIPRLHKQLQQVLAGPRGKGCDSKEKKRERGLLSIKPDHVRRGIALKPKHKN